jgi:transcriptional antiterminator RfaH
VLHWYLIYCKLWLESSALQNLERQGFECFLPLIAIEKLRRKALVVVSEPLFPRYFFIRLDASQESKSWNPIRSTTGVSRLVSIGQVPTKVDEELVTTIRKSVSSATVRPRHFAPGDALRINQGPRASAKDITGDFSPLWATAPISAFPAKTLRFLWWVSVSGMAIKARHQKLPQSTGRSPCASTVAL